MLLLDPGTDIKHQCPCWIRTHKNLVIIFLENDQSLRWVENNEYGFPECASKEKQALSPHGSHPLGAGLETDEVRFV